MFFRPCGIFLENYSEILKIGTKAVESFSSSLAHLLGSTRSVARKNYICLVILNNFEKGDLDGWIRRYANFTKRYKDNIVPKKALVAIKGVLNKSSCIFIPRMYI